MISRRATVSTPKTSSSTVNQTDTFLAICTTPTMPVPSRRSLAVATGLTVSMPEAAATVVNV